MSPLLNEANDGQADFTAPSVHSVNCRVKIESTQNSSNSATGSAFTIRDVLDVTEPNNSTPPWLVGTTHAIEWTYTGPNTRYDTTPLTVKIEYSYDGDVAHYTTLATGVSIGSGGSGSWDWDIGTGTTLGTTAKIRVTDSYIALTTDVSEGNLVIRGNVTPVELTGSPLKVGDPLNLTWTLSGQVNFLNFYYSKSGADGPWFVIDDSGTWPAGSQPYGWTVPDAITDEFRIKIEDAENPSTSNHTENDVRIIGKIQIDKPDEAEPDWVVGTSREIKFTPTGTYSVLIEGSTNGFSDELETWTIATVSYTHLRAHET